MKCVNKLGLLTFLLRTCNPKKQNNPNDISHRWSEDNIQQQFDTNCHSDWMFFLTWMARAELGVSFASSYELNDKKFPITNAHTLYIHTVIWSLLQSHCPILQGSNRWRKAWINDYEETMWHSSHKPILQIFYNL